jgi:hypothetical protein
MKELIEKWRHEADDLVMRDDASRYASALDQCADELEQALNDLESGRTVKPVGYSDELPG